MKPLKTQLTKPLYQNSFDGDSYHSYILFENMNKILEEQTAIAKEYTKQKCQELLLLVAEKAKIKENRSMSNGYDYTERYIDKDSILNCVDLEEFCS